MLRVPAGAPTSPSLPPYKKPPHADTHTVQITYPPIIGSTCCPANSEFMSSLNPSRPVRPTESMRAVPRGPSARQS